jgi:hypothetical protein
MKMSFFLTKTEQDGKTGPVWEWVSVGVGISGRGENIRKDVGD